MHNPKPPEEICEDKFMPVHGIQYGLTINPDDHLQYFDKHTRINMCREQLMKDLTVLPKDVFIDIETELSLPHSTKYSFNTRMSNYPRIHFHGIIFFRTYRSLIEYLTIGTNQLKHYSINISNIKDFDGWVQYCHKQNLSQFYPTIKLKGRGPTAVYQPDNKVFKVEDCWTHNSESEEF